MDSLDPTKKQNVQYCIPNWLRDEQVRLNIKLPYVGRVQGYPEGKTRADPIAVVGFGSSLQDTWEEIKKFKYVITCSGAHPFLIERGIIPNWHVAVDPLPKNTIKLISQPHKDVEYLIASCCHPDVFEHLKEYNVKIWHVFSNEEEAFRIIPQGEWLITGGADAGLRSMTIARFMGFTHLHMFGFDGCAKGNSHAGDHPAIPKTYQDCEYNGVTYKTTPALLECARQVVHELDQMPDVVPHFYGEGLTQEMVKKEYKPKKKNKKIPIAFNKEELISKEYIELNAQLHKDNLYYGVGGGKHADTVLKLVKTLVKDNNPFPSVLDYGCLPHNSILTTDLGLKSIKWVVDNKFSGKILSIDKNNKFVWRNIIGWSSKFNRDRKNWVRLEITKSKKHLVCTSDHECAITDNILSPNIKFLPAGDTKGNYIIRYPNKKPKNNSKIENNLYNDEQIKVLLGSLMGDAYIDKYGRVYINHGIPQKKYAEFLESLFAGNITATVGGGSSYAPDIDGLMIHFPTNAQTKYIRNIVYPENKKTVRNILPLLNEISLAFWYMDDGRLKKIFNKYYVELHTQGFSEEDQNLIIQYFDKTWGIKASKYRIPKKEYFYIHLSREGSEKFFKLVQPFIIDSMKYKLPEMYRHSIPHEFNNKVLDFSAEFIKDIKKVPRVESRLYDIEVEDTHNFIANNTVVHNCGKGFLQKELSFPIFQYDPAIPEISQSPRPADLVVCCDVLEHVEPDKLKAVLFDLHRVVKQLGYFVIHTGPAQKSYANGKNTHLIQKNKNWWEKQLSKYFVIGKIFEVGPELHAIIGKKNA